MNIQQDHPQKMTMASKWAFENRNSNPKPLTKNDIGYGTPIPGSQTEARGKLAHQRVSREIWELCCIIEEHGITRKKKIPKKKKKVDDQNERDHDETEEEEEFTTTSKIDFGTLFKIYTYISDKLLGMLLRARKYGLVDFEGECLFQRQDDDVIITLLCPASKVKKMLDDHGGTFTWGKCM